MSSHIWWSDVIFRAHLMQVRLVQSLSNVNQSDSDHSGSLKIAQNCEKHHLFLSPNESKLAITILQID